jgi:hypothetical protein
MLIPQLVLDLHEPRRRRSARGLVHERHELALGLAQPSNISRDFAGMNKAYEASVAKGNQPPRATVETKVGDPKWRIEVVVTAPRSSLRR